MPRSHAPHCAIEHGYNACTCAFPDKVTARLLDAVRNPNPDHEDLDES